MTQKKSKIIRDNKLVKVNMNPELVFRRALTLAKSRGEVTVKSVLEKPVTAVPSSIFLNDGTKRKPTNKAHLRHKLDASVEKYDQVLIPDTSQCTYIRDTMAILQGTNVKNFQSFSDLAKNYMQRISKALEKYNTVIEVYDQYQVELSTKEEERNRRQQGYSFLLFYNILFSMLQP